MSNTEEKHPIRKLLENVWSIIVVGLVVIFGGVIVAFSSLNDLLLVNEVARYIFIVVFILFLALLWFNVYIWWRQGAIFIDPIDLAAKKFGFKNDKMEMETNIYADGSFTWTRNIELEVVDYELESREYSAYVLGDNKLIDPNIEVTGDAGDSKIYHRITQKGDKSIIFVVEFSPALKKGRKATYSIIEKYGPGGYAMDRDFISDMIKKSKWKYNEPYEEDTSKVTYPIKKLIKKTVLPMNYNIGGKEYWDVVIGDGTTRAIGEYNRIKKKEEKYFSKEEIDNKTILKLDIDNPEIGLSYVLKWIPPTKEEYEKLLKESEAK